MSRILGLLAFVLLAAAAVPAAHGQAATVTCSDGRVLATSPFNPNPCGAAVPASDPDPEPEAPPAATAPPAPPSTPSTPSNPAPSAPATTSSTVTCADGRVVRPTPFNPNPCGAAAPAPPAGDPPADDPPAATPVTSVDESAVPDDFLAAYGGPPTPTGQAIEDRLAGGVFDARFHRFVGLGYEPQNFGSVAQHYSLWGLGDPVFFRDAEGDQVRWPDAPFRPAQATVILALSRADAVVATWQTQVILRGGSVGETHAGVPVSVVELLAAREAGEELGGSEPRIVTINATSIAAALHEDGPEVAANWGAVPGLLTAPAAPGQFIRLFATAPAEASELSLRIGGRLLNDDEFAFEQTSPGFYALSVRLPADLAPGDLSVVLTADGVSTPNGPYLTAARR